jgi:alpha-tubulin suppressor-like RCC1 family protein
MKEYISQEKIIDMHWSYWGSIILTQSGNVYQYLVHEEDDEETSRELGDIIDSKEREKSEKYIHFKLKSFKNSSFENEKIVMISCGERHSLALTGNGRVFGWGDFTFRQLGVDFYWHSREPIIIELNDLKIQKISCGRNHSLLLSCDGDIYAFGWNTCGEVGNGTEEAQEFPIKLELNKKFIDIASHPYYEISMSQSIDGIYYIWGSFEDENVLGPQSTRYQSFEDILRGYDLTDNMKAFDKLVEFEVDVFISNSFRKL